MNETPIKNETYHKEDLAVTVAGDVFLLVRPSILIWRDYKQKIIKIIMGNTKNILKRKKKIIFF